MHDPPKPRRLDRPITVSLEDLVPADNFSRYLEVALDLGFVRDRVKDATQEVLTVPTVHPFRWVSSGPANGRTTRVVLGGGVPIDAGVCLTS